MRDINPILERLSAARENFLAAIHSISDDRWLQPPRPEAWSACEVAVHVGMVERSVSRLMNRVLSAPPASVPFLKRLHLPIWVAGVRVPKIKSPIQIKTELLGDRQKVTEWLAVTRHATAEFLDANRGRDLSVYRAPHPLLGSLNFYEWHEFLASHDDRHRKQVRDIAESFRV